MCLGRCAGKSASQSNRCLGNLCITEDAVLCLVHFSSGWVLLRSLVHSFILCRWLKTSFPSDTWSRELQMLITFSCCEVQRFYTHRQMGSNTWKNSILRNYSSFGKLFSFLTKDRKIWSTSYTITTVIVLLKTKVKVLRKTVLLVL